MDIKELQIRIKNKRQILFSKTDPQIMDLMIELEEAGRKACTLWALEMAQESANILLEKYPDDRRPIEAVMKAESWARGEIKMPEAKRAILSCHAMAKEIENKADIALCHAVAQACSTVHTVRHAIGYPIYHLTSIVWEHGSAECEKIIGRTLSHYYDKINFWLAQDAKLFDWAPFFEKE